MFYTPTRPLNAVLLTLTLLGPAAPSKLGRTTTEQHSPERSEVSFDNREFSTQLVSLWGLVPVTSSWLLHIAAVSAYLTNKARGTCPPGNSVNHLCIPTSIRCCSLRLRTAPVQMCSLRTFVSRRFSNM